MQAAYYFYFPPQKKTQNKELKGRLVQCTTYSIFLPHRHIIIILTRRSLRERRQCNPRGPDAGVFMTFHAEF